MAIYGRTKNFKLIKPMFDSNTWHNYEYENLDVIDAVIGSILITSNFMGLWKNSTSYSVGDMIIDADGSTMYSVEVDHITDATSTFAEYYEANPTYYLDWNGYKLSRDWATKIDGTVDDSEYSSKYYANQSSGSAAMATTKAGEASDSATLASQWATQLTTPVDGGEYSAKQYALNAGTSENNANNSASAASNSVTLAQEWAAKTNGMVGAEDYSAKAYAIGGTGTETNNAKYYKEMSQAHAVDAGLSANDASGYAIRAENAATSSHALPLLASLWSDHLINDMSYLRADTFSWHDAVPYVDAYAHLVADIDGKTPQAETIDGITITYYLADDGHKIVLPDQESNVLSLYNNTGIGWYYILDVDNERFKLPRTKYAFSGWRGDVGGYIPESLPNITGASCLKQNDNDGNPSGAFYRGNANSFVGFNSAQGHFINFDASRSSSTYQDGAPVQQRATEMYLYFYVGNFTQSAIEQTAGLNAELFNAKANIALDNLDATGQAKFDAKADTDASNFTATGKETVVGWGMPDYSAGVSKALDVSITATRNCFVVVLTANGTSTAGLYVNGAKIGVGGNVYATSYNYLTAYVAKGQTYRTENIATYGSYVASVTEYPLIGG